MILSTAALLAYSSGRAADPLPAADTWPQWRGPERNGHFAGPAWPEKLQGSLREIWRAQLGPGYSGPLVTTNLVITFETKGKQEEIARAFDRRTGEKKWRVAWEGAMKVPFFAAENGSWVRSTPATDGTTVYFGGMRDLLVALDVATGAERWRADLMSRHQSALPAFGFVCSPLIDGDALYVQAAGGVLRLNRATGGTVWRSMDDGGGMNGSAFSSPVIETIGGVRQLVVQTREKLAGLSLEDGKVLWAQKVEAFRGMNILPPTVVKDDIFTAAYGGKAQVFRVAKAGEAWQVSELWSVKQQGYMSSPVLIDGKIYLHLRNQRFISLDFATGAAGFTSEKPLPKYLSMVWQGDRMLALDDRGQLRLIKANPAAYEPIDQVSVSDEPDTWAHLAPAGNQLFVRAIDKVIAWEWVR